MVFRHRAVERFDQRCAEGVTRRQLSGRNGSTNMALRWTIYFGTAVLSGAAIFATSPGHAQHMKATTLEEAEMAGLSPQMRAEVEARMKRGGQTVSEILTTILLNSIKLKHLGSRIIAMDFNRGVAVVQTAQGEMREVKFNPTTLEIES